MTEARSPRRRGGTIARPEKGAGSTAPKATPGTDPRQESHDHKAMETAIATLAESLAEVATYNYVGDALQKGFQNLAAQLAPLRDLGPLHTPSLSCDVATAMASVQQALQSPDWGMGGPMPVVDAKRVAFIGEAVPCEPPIPTLAPDRWNDQIESEAMS